MKNANISILNKKALHDYEIIESYMVGLVLTGAEVKSLRINTPNLRDSYCAFINQSTLISTFGIPSLKNEDRFGQVSPDRPKTLLLTKKELSHLYAKSSQKGLTIVPIRLYTYKGLFKMEIALCRGKKLYDKRQALKEKDLQRHGFE